VSRRSGWIAAALLAGCHGATPFVMPDRVLPGSFSDRSVTVETASYRYKLFVPAGYTASRRWPVVLFLHGMGERGSDNERPAHYSLGAWLKGHAEGFPAIVVIPQVPADSYWTGQPARAALAALERTVRELHGDRRRLYLTGLSMGGYGTWEMLAGHRRLFAAAAVICGGVVAPGWDSLLRVRTIPPGTPDQYAYIARQVGTTPVWLFHGDADNTVPVTESRRMADALRRSGNTMVRYTEYPGGGHNVWDRAYADPELWRWLFAQRRSR